MNKRVLVTGGCGFIGSNLVHKLVESGWLVDVVDDMSNGTLDNLDGLTFKVVLGFMIQQYELGYENNRKRETVLVIQDDFESKNVLRRVVEGKYDRVFHLAANPRVSYSVEHPAKTTDVNVTRTMSLIESINKAPNKPRLIFSSTSAVYGETTELPTPETCSKNPQSPYGLQKLMVEEFLRMSHRLYGTDSVCLRYANVYGPRQLGNSPYSTAISAWCNRVADNESLRSDGDGEQTRDMVYVNDVVRANILAATREESFIGDVFNVGTGTYVSNNEILKMFREKFSNIRVTNAPLRTGDVRSTQLDVRKAKRELDYTALTTLENGLQETWNCWKL